MLLFASCQKTVDTTGSANFRLNGKPVSTSTNYCEFDYYSGKFSSIDFNFITANPNEGYFDLHIGSYSGNPFNSLYPTDSLVSGTNYSALPYRYTLDSIQVIQSGNFILHFNVISDSTLDGSFSGIVTGIDTTTSTMITDTVSYGVFTNIPIHRIFH
jgi:hypothetical protein